MSPVVERADPPRIDLSELGVTEHRWAPILGALPTIDVAGLCGAAPPARCVVVAPHPDDETLGVGGTVATLAATGVEIVVVSVTDGEAAPVTWPDLAALRRDELRCAVGRLAPDGRIVRFALPDGGLVRCADELTDRLTGVLDADDLVLAPYPDDGHPDHDACGRAAVAAATTCAAVCWSYPVWAWHWHDPARSSIGTRGRRLQLPVVAARAKAAAIDCYRSQIEHEPPVVPRSAMARYRRPFEVLVPG